MKGEAAVSFSSFMIVFAHFVAFNIFDLSSTILALKLGLSEANFALNYLSSTFGLALSDVIMLVKSVFFIGVGSLILLGVISKNQSMKKSILVTTILFGAIFALVSVNNFLSIYYLISA